MLLASYVVGSVSAAYLLARLVRGVDIRRVGSRNPGALNIFREVGAWHGAAVLAFDALKGTAVILVVMALDMGDYAMFVGALGAVIGHNWSVFLGFHGGRGVATIFGISLAVLPLWTLVSLALALASGFATRSVVFGIGIGIIAINALTISTSQGAAQISLCLTLSAVVIATHYGMAYRQVMASVHQRGLWGLFEVE